MAVPGGQVAPLPETRPSPVGVVAGDLGGRDQFAGRPQGEVGARPGGDDVGRVVVDEHVPQPPAGRQRPHSVAATRAKQVPQVDGDADAVLAGSLRESVVERAVAVGPQRGEEHVHAVVAGREAVAGLGAADDGHDRAVLADARDRAAGRSGVAVDHDAVDDVDPGAVGDRPRVPGVGPVGGESDDTLEAHLGRPAGDSGRGALAGRVDGDGLVHAGRPSAPAISVVVGHRPAPSVATLSRRVLSPDVRAGLGVRMAAVLAVLLAVSAAVGWLLLAGVRAVVGGVADDPATGVAVVGAFAVGFALVQYVLGRRLAVASVDAVDLPADRYPGVHRTVAEVADGYGIATPRVMVARMGAPNAFAVGRRGDSTVVLSVELLFLLDRTELEAVIAHELAHVHHRDSVLLTATATVRSLVEGVVTTVALAVGGAVALLVEGGTRLLHPQNRGTGVDWTRTVALWVWGVTVLALLGLLLFSAALSRHREFAADASAAALLGDGDALADALEKIARSQAESPLATLGTHSAESDPLAALATHPPVEERIGRLRTPRR